MLINYYRIFRFYCLKTQNFYICLNYKIKCAIGKNGISKNKREGDLKTPSGIFMLKKIYYRKNQLWFTHNKLYNIFNF